MSDLQALVQLAIAAAFAAVFVRWLWIKDGDR